MPFNILKRKKKTKPCFQKRGSVVDGYNSVYNIIQ